MNNVLSSSQMSPIIRSIVDPVVLVSCIKTLLAAHNIVVKKPEELKLTFYNFAYSYKNKKISFNQDFKMSFERDFIFESFASFYEEEYLKEFYSSSYTPSFQKQVFSDFSTFIASIDKVAPDFLACFYLAVCNVYLMQSSAFSSGSIFKCPGVFMLCPVEETYSQDFLFESLIHESSHQIGYIYELIHPFYPLEMPEKFKEKRKVFKTCMTLSDCSIERTIHSAIVLEITDWLYQCLNKPSIIERYYDNYNKAFRHLNFKISEFASEGYDVLTPHGLRLINELSVKNNFY